MFAGVGSFTALRPAHAAAPFQKPFLSICCSPDVGRAPRSCSRIVIYAMSCALPTTQIIAFVRTGNMSNISRLLKSHVSTCGEPSFFVDQGTCISVLWRMISALLGVGASGPLNWLGVFRRVPLLPKDYGNFQEVFLIAALVVQLL